jgi:hypothetical protein
MCFCEERSWQMLRAAVVVDARKQHDAVAVTDQRELKCYCSNDCARYCSSRTVLLHHR